MRRYHKKTILELVTTLKEAYAETERLFFNNEISALVQLLSDSQKCAIQMGSIIEQLEGEGTKTVSHIEKYCDILYRIHVDIKDSGGDKGLFRKLNEQIRIIKNSVINDLKADRFEMLFIPYKASMWDSMESVWLAAKDDPRCDAVVVPVPYFDRLPGGKLGKMHDESHQYPDYVPITAWQKYDAEERCPDVIVTHNPYDSNNIVTSIHPKFYNKRLRNFTDLLFYIPYFACIKDVPRHFCVCPGTIYAHKVSVQSEKIRQTYIREFQEMEKTRGKGTMGVFNSKFIVTGSPKFDKAINTKREDCLIPEEWERLIVRPDGTRKKVILYNTSITGLLEGNEKVLQKLRLVFDCFDNQKDAVLLWRPHPLNVAAYESMRPQLLEQYLGIVDEYKRQGFGIYDDTSDLHRAIAVSDAYYGDWSSLVAIYQCLGKPVMIQDLNIKSPNVQEGLVLSEDAIKENRCQTLIKEKTACETLYDCCIIERNDFTLDDLVYYIVRHSDLEPAKKIQARQTDIFRRMNRHSDGTSGSAIYAYCVQRALS